MVHLPTTKQLKYLVALDTHKHFGRAAQACFISQSAFSIAIKELESLLKVQLVDRTQKSITITQMGQEVVTQAKLVLRDIEMLVETASGQREILSGRVNLGIIPTIAPFLVPKVLPKLGNEFPKLKLYLKEDITQRLYVSLMAGELDLILIAFPYELKNVTTLKLFKDHFRLAVRKNSKLIDPQHYSFNRLNRESVLLLEDGHCMRDQALSACRIKNLDTVNQFAGGSLLTLIQMVDSDLGITFVPEMAEGTSLLKNTQVKTYALPERSYREIGLCWRKGSALDSEFETLGKAINKYK